MSCFWDTLIKKVNVQDMKNVLKITNPTPKIFSNALKNENMKVENVLWNSNELTVKERQENFDHIKEYDINTVTNGYLCSVCDPFLLLIAELFKVEIIHHYHGNTIHYKYSMECKYTITINSDKGHMW
jgi:hypothetical protein